MFVQRFVTEVSKIEDTPLEFLNGIAYFIAGAALADCAHFPFPDAIRSNIYLLLVAGPGWMRKSTTTRLGHAILSKLGLPAVSGYGSAESFVQECDNLQKRNIYHATMVYDEFKGFIGHTSKEYAAGIRTFVTERLQRGLPFTQTRKDKFEPTGVKEVEISGDFILSFIASTTTAWMFEGSKMDGVSSGFYARFLIVESHKRNGKVYVPAPYNDSVFDALARELMSVRAFYKNLGDMQFKMSEDALEIYKSAYDTIEKESLTDASNSLADFSSRLPLYMVKLSLINAMLNRRKGIVEEADMDAATEMVLKSFTSCKYVTKYGLNESKFSQSVSKVEAFLEKREGKVASLRDVYRLLKVPKSESENVITYMADAGIVDWDGKNNTVRLLPDKEQQKTSLNINGDVGAAGNAHTNGNGKTPLTETVL